MDKNKIKEQYQKIVNVAKHFVSQSVSGQNFTTAQNCRLKAIDAYNRLLECLDVTDYLLIDSTPIVPTPVYTEAYFMLGTLYKTCVEAELQNNISSLRKNELNRTTPVQGLTQSQNDMCRKAISCFINILRVKFEDEAAVQQIVSVYTHMCFVSQSNLQVCLQYLQEALLYAPESETIHYNLGIVYQKLNKLELSLIHYKLSLQLSEVTKQQKGFTQDLINLTLNNYNGIASIYRSIKQWPEALYYLLKAEKVNNKDPDIQNQLGVVYTEMRRTDLAETAYTTALQHVDSCFISTDSSFLTAETYLNFGHMHSYNGDNHNAIESYNKALRICPKFTLPFQNKLMNLSYIFDQLEDKMYIFNQHKNVNKLYKKSNGKYTFDKTYFNNPKINIGIISGDFTDHPVSFFISTFLKCFNNEKFNVTCYSECIIDTGLYSANLKFKFIKNMTTEVAADLVYNDKIHILFDLAGHTAFNRLDVFAMKPSPIQITYIGYPYSTGLDEMDYRITDNICDKPEVSQKFYTETLKMLDNCFLCYDPTVIKRDSTGQPASFQIPQLTEQPYLDTKTNKILRIGCFNRVNKITDSVIKEINKIMLQCPNVHFVFKTKALINKQIHKQFLKKFNKTLHDKITVLDCTISHESHLAEYNKVDIALDTSPYSGTTTSCEALFMGVPVFSIWDKEWWFHCSNVTVSILKNSNLDFYVCESSAEIIKKINILQEKPIEFWKTLKENTRTQFLSGKVCDKKQYMENIEHLLTELFNKHKVN